MTTQNQDPNQISAQNSEDEKSVDSSVQPEQVTDASSKHTAEAATSSSAAQPKESPLTVPVTTFTPKPKSCGLSILALLLSLIALGGSGILFYQGQTVLKNMENAWGSKLGEAGIANKENLQQLKESFARQDAIALQMIQFDDRLNQAAGQYNTLNNMYQELTKTRFDWLMAETEYTLNLAAQQLQLSGNVPGAISALESIDLRLSKFDRPELIALKRAISEDIANLKKQPYLDVTGLTLKLDRLQTALPSLPMVLDSLLKSRNSQPKVMLPENTGWWDSIWHEMSSGLKDLVQVQKINSTDALLLSPEQSFFVKENIKLRLLDARLALMQHQGEIYQHDLSAIESAFKQYFDQSAPTTQAWLKELSELKAASFDTSTAGLSASIAAVRTYQSSLAELPERAKTPATASAASAPNQAPSSAPVPNSALTNTAPPTETKTVEPMTKGRAL